MKRRTRRRWRPVRVLVGTVALGLTAVVAWQAWTWPDVAALAHQRPRTTAFIERYRTEERAAGRQPRVAWTWANYGRIAPALKRAVIVAEDINFFSHRGFETREMREALKDALEEGALPRGASTITQQLAKNLWLSPSRHPLRKAKEAALTWQLEWTLSKRRILELYLNVAEFGPGVYGVEAASLAYFGKRAADVSEHEAAQLAASLPRPATWHPGVTSRAYARYVLTIERRLAKARFLVRHI
jgi:monofunctional biosynthetic peptidoglycan transglycosylase